MPRQLDRVITHTCVHVSSYVKKKRHVLFAFEDDSLPYSLLPDSGSRFKIKLYRRPTEKALYFVVEISLASFLWTDQK